MHLPETLLNEHYQKLYRFQDEVLTFIKDSNPVFYLGGGTALSRFHYNHRYSDDLDFFTLEELNFIESVQDLHQKLEETGYRVSTFGVSQKFARLSLEEPERYPGCPLKCDFIASRKGVHVGNFGRNPIYSHIDNPKNILTEKISFLHKKFPKDIADVWVICRNLSFNWEEVIEQANQKRTTDPLLAAESLESFQSEQLENVRWIRPLQVKQFERDREVIVQNIITKGDNQISIINKLY